MIDIWHLGIPVRNLEKSLRFYVAGLGFEFMGYYQDNLGFVRPPEKSFILELIEMQKNADGANKTPHHLAFEVENLDKFRAGLIARKVAPEIPEIKPTHSGMVFLELRDPDGIRVQFFHGRAGFDSIIKPTIAQYPRANIPKRG